jgi:hypothetical protein
MLPRLLPYFIGNIFLIESFIFKISIAHPYRMADPEWQGLPAAGRKSGKGQGCKGCQYEKNNFRHSISAVIHFRNSGARCR